MSKTIMQKYRILL